MKRDITLIIKLLEYLESREEGGLVEVAPIEGYNNATITYHQILLDDAGFVFAERQVSNTTPQRIITSWPWRLTWQGHEFLAATRQQQVWHQIKAHFGKNLAEAPLDTVFIVAKRLLQGYAEKRISPLIGLSVDTE